MVIKTNSISYRFIGFVASIALTVFFHSSIHGMLTRTRFNQFTRPAAQSLFSPAAQVSSPFQAPQSQYHIQPLWQNNAPSTSTALVPYTQPSDQLIAFESAPESPIGSMQDFIRGFIVSNPQEAFSLAQSVWSLGKIGYKATARQFSRLFPIAKPVTTESGLDKLIANMEKYQAKQKTIEYSPEQQRKKESFYTEYDKDMEAAEEAEEQLQQEELKKLLASQKPKAPPLKKTEYGRLTPKIRKGAQQLQRAADKKAKTAGKQKPTPSKKTQYKALSKKIASAKKVKTPEKPLSPEMQKVVDEVSARMNAKLAAQKQAQNVTQETPPTQVSSKTTPNESATITQEAVKPTKPQATASPTMTPTIDVQPRIIPQPAPATPEMPTQALSAEPFIQFTMPQVTAPEVTPMDTPLVTPSIAKNQYAIVPVGQPYTPTTAQTAPEAYTTSFDLKEFLDEQQRQQMPFITPKQQYTLVPTTGTQAARISSNTTMTIDSSGINPEEINFIAQVGEIYKEIFEAARLDITKNKALKLLTHTATTSHESHALITHATAAHTYERINEDIQQGFEKIRTLLNNFGAQLNKKAQEAIVLMTKHFMNMMNALGVEYDEMLKNPAHAAQPLAVSATHQPLGITHTQQPSVEIITSPKTPALQAGEPQAENNDNNNGNHEPTTKEISAQDQPQEEENQQPTLDLGKVGPGIAAVGATITGMLATPHTEAEKQKDATEKIKGGTPAIETPAQTASVAILPASLAQKMHTLTVNAERHIAHDYRYGTTHIHGHRQAAKPSQVEAYKTFVIAECNALQQSIKQDAPHAQEQRTFIAQYADMMAAFLSPYIALYREATSAHSQQYLDRYSRQRGAVQQQIQNITQIIKAATQK